MALRDSLDVDISYLFIFTSASMNPAMNMNHAASMNPAMNHAASMNPAMNHAASMNPAMNNMADNTGADYGKYSSLLLLSIYLLHCRI